MTTTSSYSNLRRRHELTPRPVRVSDPMGPRGRDRCPAAHMASTSDPSLAAQDHVWRTPPLRPWACQLIRQELRKLAVPVPVRRSV